MADEKKRIIDYPETNTVGDDDYLLMSQYNETTEQYDSKKVKAVKVGGGGGGTTVVANPTGAATDDLEKVQIGSTIYGIQGGATVYSGLETPANNIGANGDLYARYKAYLSDYDIGYSEIYSRNTPLIVKKKEGSSPTMDFVITECTLNIKQYKMVNNVEELVFEYADDIDFSDIQSWIQIEDEGTPVCYVGIGASTIEAPMYVDKCGTTEGKQQFRLVVNVYPKDIASLGIQNLYLKRSGAWVKDSFGNEVVELTGTLSDGSTSLAFMDDHINTDSIFDYYTSIFGVNPTNAVVSGNTLTLTFDAQEDDMSVKVRVS